MLTVVRSKKLIAKIVVLLILFTVSITGCEVVKQIESGFGIGQNDPSPTPSPTLEPTFFDVSATQSTDHFHENFNALGSPTI